MHRVAKACDLKGVQVVYDPFYNNLPGDASEPEPLWLNCLIRFGIPYISTESNIAFWDLRQAKYADNDQIIKALSKTLFVDGDAAKILCERGYGKYLGVQIGDCVTDGSNLAYDLAAREVICDNFVKESKGRNMPSAHMYNPLGNGRMLSVTPTDEKCEIVTEYYDYKKQFVTTSMTRFQNSLGGKVVVMGLTLDRNKSHALYNYRRKHLLSEMLMWADCDFAFVKEAPEVFLIENRAVDAGKSGFKGMLTLTNYCEDALDEVSIYLPKELRDFSNLFILGEDGEWQKINYSVTPDGVIVKEIFSHLSPVYILIA